MSAADVSGVERVVLPSPNGSTISFALASTGARVVAASLRNASAVAQHVAALMRDGADLRGRFPPGSAGPTRRCARASRTSGERAR